MNIMEPVRMGLEQLRVHKLRAFLSILGILISVGSVTGIISMGDGLRITITEQFEQSGGPNVITVMPPEAWYRNESGVWVRRDWEEYLESRDAEFIVQYVEDIDFVVPIISTNLEVQYQGVSSAATIRATNEHFLQTQNWEIDKGRFINSYDVRNASKVVVLGSALAEDLFGDVDPIGKEVRLQGIRCLVVGVLKPFQLYGDTNARFVIGPYTTAQKRFMGNEQINMIYVYADSPDVVDEVAQHIRPVLKRNHEHGGDFRIQTGQSAIEQFNRVVFILNAIGGGIAGISLLVGGIGIMNIMLVSVNERTREIGIRKALGAKRTSILWQFILEAIVLCLFGGALGIMLGITIGNIISVVIQHLTGEVFRCIITPNLMLFAIFYSSLIGLFFGVYPAWRASKLDPIEALRYE